MAPIHTEVLLAAGYATFLTAVALVIEAAARHTHRRSQRLPLTNFTYHAGLDVWECPAGERLLRCEPDYEHRIVRYRAPAHTCNACARKPSCTDSNSGREIVHSQLDWLETEVGRFHRGLSIALLVLTGWLMLFEVFRYRDAADLSVMAAALVVPALCFARLVRTA